MTPLPHSSQLNAALAELVAEVGSAKKAGFDSFTTSAQLKFLYRLCNATDSIVNALDHSKMRPSLQAARSVILNQPVLLLYSFMDEAMVDLRRFIELVAWSIYFSSHPVEWKAFLEGGGYSRDLDQPISFCARRELGFYLSYLDELVRSEPSGFASDAVEQLRQCVGKLNKHAHGATLARVTSRATVLKARSDAEAKALCEMAEQVFRNSAIVLCATNRKRFDSLGAVERGYFDYLVGKELARKLRSLDFGIQDG